MYGGHELASKRSKMNTSSHTIIEDNKPDQLLTDIIKPNSIYVELGICVFL